MASLLTPADLKHLQRPTPKAPPSTRSTSLLIRLADFNPADPTNLIPMMTFHSNPNSRPPRPYTPPKAS